MTKLLLRLFAKDGDRSAVGALAGITGIVCNCILFAIKLMIGLLSGSIAVLADAFNNLTDAASSITTLVGFRLAQQPADRDHPYGHARYEYLSGLAVAALILLIGAELVKTSVGKIFNPQATTVSGITIGILAVSIGLKFWMHLFFKKLGKLISSQALLATAIDSRNDFLASTAVLISCGCSLLWQVELDGIMGLAVAVFILISGFGTARDTISPLIGQQADEAMLEGISNLILRHDKVLGIHDLLVHDYGPGQCYASVHAEISAEEDPLSGHDIIDDIERDALAELNVHLVIHYDPVALQDEEQTRVQAQVADILHEISPALSMHDFRLLRYANQTRLYFDLEVPYDMDTDQRSLQTAIDDRLPGYKTFISFDKK